jgi:multidrug resistance efflux pump
MKTMTLLPIVLTGVVGGVFLIQLHTLPVELQPHLSESAAAPANSGLSSAPAGTPQAAAVQLAPALQPAQAINPPEPPALCMPGRVTAHRELDVKSKTSGQVLNVAVDAGDTVTKGQLLIELDATDAARQVQRVEATLAASRSRLAQAEENLTIAQMSLESLQTRAGACIRSAAAKALRARSKADRFRATLNKNVISREEYDEAEAAAVEASANLDISKVQLEDAKTQERTLALRREDVACAHAQVTIDEILLVEAQQRLADTKIYAPMDGLVTSRSVQPSQIISAGSSSAETRLMTLADVSRIYVTVAANAGQFGHIKLEQCATIRTEACPEAKFNGRVIRVAPRGTAGGSEVTFDIKLEILSSNRALLKPEMPVCVEFSKPACREK